MNALASKPQGSGRNALVKPMPLGLWQKLMQLFGGGPARDEGMPPEYMPIDTLPLDAQEAQRRKAQALLDAMRGD